MTVNADKLRELAQSLTDDQTRLLREGLAEGRELEVDELVSIISSYENRAIFESIAAERVTLAADAGDAGTGDAGTGDAGTGTGDGGTSPPVTEPPLTRW